VSIPPSTQTPHSRATVRLGFDCDNECVFCGQAGLAGPREGDLREELAKLRREGPSGGGEASDKLRESHDEVTFIGGEPTLDPRLPSAIAHARELGFAAVGVQTNARRLAGADAVPGLFASLVDAGLSDLQLSIHGPSAEAHDYHTGRAGSFAACMDLIARAQRADITVVVATVVTRSNFRELGKLPPTLKRRGVAAWLLEVVRPHGRAADNFARVVPRIGMALPWALHALELSRRHALSSWIRGAPVCALGPFAASALPSSPRQHPLPCSECPNRPRCPGVDATYVDVFGHSELRPSDLMAPPAEFDEGRRRLMRMFVGVGELLARPPQLSSPKTETSAASEPRRLPVLPSGET
jgi:hypothetical protein